MPHAEITVGLDDHRPGDVAAEHVQFLLTANPGSPPLPLTRVASGGELARSMLALRLVLSADDDAPRTLVFDEVDAGIGGTAAAAVGRALAEVGRHHQVLVVTHLAQVAAQATTQVAVVKTVDGDVTTARAAVVDGDDARRRAGPHAVGRRRWRCRPPPRRRAAGGRRAARSVEVRTNGDDRSPPSR